MGYKGMLMKRYVALILAVMFMSLTSCGGASKGAVRGAVRGAAKGADRGAGTGTCRVVFLKMAEGLRQMLPSIFTRKMEG